METNQPLNFQFLNVSIINAINEHRRTVSFCLVAVFILVADSLFHRFYIPFIEFLNTKFGIAVELHQLVDLGFAPEIWTGVLAVVLGTLIIVIAIAAESTPRLIDLYMKDWLSLFFIWFIVLASLHAFVSMFYGKPMDRNSSIILNTYGFLTFSYVVALPYIFYILIYSKTSNVVTTISSEILKCLDKMTHSTVYGAMEQEVIVERYQREIMDSLDQLDDLLSSVEFKETQSDLIRQIGNIVTVYINKKSKFNPKFFNLTKAIRENATYRTYTEDQYEEMQDNASFYEVKVFRLLGNSYIKMMEMNLYDIASLIPAELVDIGIACLKVDNPQIQNHINIRFNTLFRHSLKHAMRNNEPRNLYNLSFHNANLILAYIKAGEVAQTKVCYDRIKFYGNEVYKNAQLNPALYFIVDTLTFELKKCQIEVKEQNWSREDQLHLLKVVLELDQPPNFSKEGMDKSMLGDSGTRKVQIGLALYYLEQGMDDFAETIIEDYLDDLAHFNENEFRKIVESQCFLLSIFGPAFWEDTDRGTMNIYFAPEKNQIPRFKEMVNDQIIRRLKKLEADTQYLSMEVEALLNKKHIQEGFLNETDLEKLEELQYKISLRKSRPVEEGIWAIENDMLFNLISIAFSDRDIDESEKDVIQSAFKYLLPDISAEKFDTIFIATAQKYMKLQEPEAQTEQYVKSLKELSTYFDHDLEKLHEILFKYIELANADNFIHENEVLLIELAIEKWELGGSVKQDDKERLIYVRKS